MIRVGVDEYPVMVREAWVDAASSLMPGDWAGVIGQIRYETWKTGGVSRTTIVVEAESVSLICHRKNRSAS